MKFNPTSTSQALGITASLLAATAPQLNAASVDTPPGFFIANPTFSDSGTTIGATNDISLIAPGVSAYTTVNGPDVFYTFNVVTPGTLNVTATPTGGTGYDIAVYLMANDALGANAIFGRDSALGNGAENFTTGVLGVGTYFIAIDSFYSTGSISAGAYTLNLVGGGGIAFGPAVPEPGSLALGALGLGAIGWRRRRQGGR